MRIITLLLLVGWLSITQTAMASGIEGLIRVKSDASVSETSARLQQAINDKGLTLFTVIDHSEGAAKAGHNLLPTQLVIFGNPKVGTVLMQCARSVAIDLPQKMLVWEDAKGQVWIGYNSPAYLNLRHQLSGCEKVLGKIDNLLAALSKEAAGE